MALVGQAVSEKKIFETVDGRTDGRRTDGRRTADRGHPISSPCEPNGSGELINIVDLNHSLFILRPSQGFWGFREKGYLFSGIWGEGSFIFRDLGREQDLGSRGLRKNILGSWGERSFFFQGAGSKDPPPPPWEGLHIVKYTGWPVLESIYRVM